jgi:hypothetical protein
MTTLVPLLLVVAQDPMARDATPLPRYLSAGDVHDVIEASGLELGACVPRGSKDAETHIHFRVEPDGSFAAVELSGLGQPAIETCISGVFAKMRARAHDELPLVVDYTIAIRSGVLVPFPIVAIAARDPFPRFWYLPPDVDPAARKRLEHDLGLVTSEPGVDSGSNGDRPWTSTAD